jgi:hypothetical protein
VETLSDWLRRDIGLTEDLMSWGRIDEIKRMHGGWP